MVVIWVQLPPRLSRAVLANVNFKTGYHPEFLGEYAEAKASRNRLLLLSLASICAIAVILYIDFQSWNLWRDPLHLP